MSDVPKSINLTWDKRGAILAMVVARAGYANRSTSSKFMTGSKRTKS